MNTEIFEANRKRLVGIAYRMTGSVASAEDIVQETALRWLTREANHDQGVADIERPAAWLTTVCTRLCIDELSSARVRREHVRGQAPECSRGGLDPNNSHVGPWLPEPWIEEAPADPGPLGQSLSMAVLLLLEELSPKERAAFLLREVFEEEYEHIAAILETSPQTVRQWVRRARAAIDQDRPRFDSDPLAQAALLAAFGAACATGDPHELEKLLAADIIATSDGGGRVYSSGPSPLGGTRARGPSRVHAALRPIYGPSAVARFLIGILRKAGPSIMLEPAWVNGMAGAVARRDGHVVAVTSIEGLDGRVRRWRTVVDPLKLRHLQ